MDFNLFLQFFKKSFYVSVLHCTDFSTILQLFVAFYSCKIVKMVCRLQENLPWKAGHAKVMLSVAMRCVVMLSVIMLSVIMLSVIMLSVVMPSVVMPSVVMLNAVLLNVVAP